MSKFDWNQFEEASYNSEQDEDYMDCMGNKYEKANRFNTPCKISYEVEGIQLEITLPNVSAKELIHRLVKVAKFINEAEAEYCKLVK